MEIGYIKKREITEEMKESYLDYAMSVIISRALPDVRDGLKPVHRRILYSMHEMGLTHTAKYRKSAAVTGFCMGAFHPHGDTPIYEALVRMAQNFSLRYPLVDGQGNFGCFTKDIKVRLTDGRGLTFGELIKEAKKGKRNWTFSFNPEIQKIEIAEIENPRLTRRKEKIMEITLDNGKNIKCTLDHLFMLRNGSYKKAKDLKAGNSLMPLYTEIYQGEDTNLRGYEIMCQPLENTWDFVHHLADKWNLRNGIYEKSKGKIRHHLDFNKLNNNPDNVLRIQWGDHWKFHKEIASERHKNDQEYVKKIAEGRRKFWAKKENKKLYSQLRAEKNRVMWRNPKYREMWIEARKKMWEDPKYKEFMRKASSKNLKNLWKRKDFQELMSKIKSQELKRRWQNESYRNIMAEWMRKLSLKIWSNPQHREYISKLMKEKSNDPNWRKRQSKIAKALWRDPEYRAKYSPDHFSKMAKKLWGDPQFRELHREKAIKQWQNPEFKEKIIKAVRIRNKQRMKENPEFMKGLTERAKISLHKNWQDPFYKERVIKSKILGFVYSLLGKYKKITPRIYEQERTNNGVPRLKNALDYFDSLSEIINKAQKYNHQIVATRVLQKRKDVYDLTIEPYHNFCLDAGVFVHNSIDADPPASQRYTESRLSKMAEEMLSDIDKETVDWTDNYDATRKEPTVLPAKLPQLLLNGSMGIAVGMATNIPPHHLGELVEGIIFLIDHPKAATEELCQFIKGPDFPTGGFIYDRPGIIQAYSTGRGPIVSRAKTEIVEKKAGQFQVLITEMTYGVNKAALIEKIADLVKEKRIEGIKDIRDESDKEGVRVVIDLKSDAYPQKILHRLFKLTDLQKTFHLNMLALVDGLQPQVLSLKAVLEHYIKHRQQVVIRRAQFELKQAKERTHILEGLSKALDQIDAVIQTIKKSLTREQAHQNLVKKFKLTSQQATAILEMRLQTLAGLEQKKIKDELKEKKKLIEELERLLKSPKKILEKIKKELQEIKEKYQDNRRTKVYASPVGQFKEEEMVPEEECIIILTQGGYVKRVSPRGYRTQKRGGRGIVGIIPREEDVVGYFLSASTHDNILFFTGQGRVFQTKAYEIPEASRTARGQAIVNILQMGSEEKVTAIVPLGSKGSEAKFLLMTTKNGINKKTAVEEFVHVRRSGLVAIKLDKGDELKWARPSSGQDEIILVTTKGQSIRFKEKDVRPMGRPAAGVRGIKLRKGDEVVGMDIISSKFKVQSSKLLVVTENGFGKKTDLRYYKLQKRGGSGIKTAKITSKTGNIVASQILGPGQEDLIVISQKGQVIRTKLKDISTLGRATQGVRIMRLDKEDKVASVTCI